MNLFAAPQQEYGEAEGEEEEEEEELLKILLKFIYCISKMCGSCWVKKYGAKF